MLNDFIMEGNNAEDIDDGYFDGLEIVISE